jgi:hypothetical protein
VQLALILSAVTIFAEVALFLLGKSYTVQAKLTVLPAVGSRSAGVRETIEAGAGFGVRTFLSVDTGLGLAIGTPVEYGGA